MQARQTLTRYYVYSLLSGLQLTWTVWLAYVVAHNGNPGWAEAAFHLAIWLGEVPTGIVADLLGRRLSMLAGLGVGALTSFGYLWIHDTWSACLVLGISGLGGTFLSGADTALLYESAEEIGGTDLARRAMARSAALRTGGLAVAPAIAGLLYEWHELAPFMVQAGLSLLTIWVVWGMAERRPERDPAARLNPWAQLRAGVQAVWQNPRALTLILFSWIYFTATAMTSQFAQAYFPHTGLTMAAAGLVFAGARILSTGGSALSERLSAGSAQQWLRFAPVFLALTFLGMGAWGGCAGVVCFAVGAAIDGVLEPVVDYRLNAVIPSAQRATILSLQSAGFSMMMSVAFPAAAYLQPVSHIYTVVGHIGALLAAGWMCRRPITQSPGQV